MESKRLELLSKIKILDSQVEKSFDDITFLASSMSNAPMSLISFVDDSRAWFKSKIGVTETECDSKGSFCEQVVKRNEVVTVSDALLHDAFKDNPFVNNGLRFYVGVPIRLNDIAVGSLCIGDFHPRFIEEKDLEVLKLLAKQVERELEKIITIAALEKTQNLPKKKARILIAEDNSVNQVIAVKMLQKMGHYSYVVSNGFEAIEALRNASYDLVLMDCQMPEMDGYEATRTIRSLETLSWKDIPILAFTANTMAGDAEKCLSSGMDGYISKPVSHSKLEKIIEEWLSKKRVVA